MCIRDSITDSVFRRAVELIDTGDETGLRAHLKQHPDLARKRVVFEGMNYFHKMCIRDRSESRPGVYCPEMGHERRL